MPRQARLDIPGALHHVMVLGINKTVIFGDDQDRTQFLTRLGDKVTVGHCTVTYAWKADAGTLSAFDTNPVIWKAPEAEGRYQVSVEVTNAAGARAGGSAQVLVSRHPAAQLVASVYPMGRKLCSTDVAGVSSQASSGN
jgi:hypothetical protein